MKNFSLKRERNKREERLFSYTKRMTSIILYNAIVWVYLTYILAFAGKENIAEQLSINVVKVVIYTFIPYLCKSLFEKVFMYQREKRDDLLDKAKSPEDVAKEVKETINDDTYVPHSSSNIDDTEIIESDLESSSLDFSFTNNDDETPVG